MSLWLIALVTAVYFATGLIQATKGQMGFALMWFAYALANVGIIMAGGAK